MDLESPTSGDISVDILESGNLEKKKLNKNNVEEKDRVMVSAFMNPPFLRDFIETYRNATCLWQVASKEYHNRQKRDAAMKELLEFTLTVVPDATLLFLKKRIENIRSCFRREFGKVQASKTSGTGTDNVYIPKLWYYELLEFTAAQENPTKSKSSLPCSSEPVYEEMEPEEEESNTSNNFNTIKP